MKTLRRGYMFLVMGKDDKPSSDEILRVIDCQFEKAAGRLKPDESIIEVAVAPDVHERLSGCNRLDGIPILKDPSVPRGLVYFIVENENKES